MFPPAPPPEPFDDSRRLTGPNLFFAVCGAVLDVSAAFAPDAAVETAWHERVMLACEALGWPTPQTVARRHAHGASLALSAPIDQLFTATSVNEWAWLDALGLPWTPDIDDADPAHAPSPPPAAISDRATALATLRTLAQAEHRPALIALVAEATRRGLPTLIDDALFTIGSGTGARTWPLDALPSSTGVEWPSRHRIPTALITGTNGKTTTTRVLAAIAREAGFVAGHSSTTGLVVGGQSVMPGDYSGPAGTRAILRDARVQIAVLETARGGMLRRGLALNQADAALVTNLSADHFGEYGIDDLEGLADTKLIVAHAISSRGLLVLNADDPMLVQRAAALTIPIAWFGLDDAHAILMRHRGQGGATAGIDSKGHMRLVQPARGIDADLGAVAVMPLTVNGHPAYNIANLLGAALVAAALRLPIEAITRVFARFGTDRQDNPGRLQHWRLPEGVNVYIDYAHNPQGLRGLLAVATAAPHSRLGLVLGQAGNRADAEMRELAAIAAAFKPAWVVLKDIAGMQRGRAPGEVGGILRDELIQQGVASEAIGFESLELDAAKAALRWAQPGDVVVLPIHGAAAVDEVQSLLDRCLAEGLAAVNRG